MKLFKWLVSLVSVSLLSSPIKVIAANNIERKQTEEAISKEKSNLLILQHSKDLFGEKGSIEFARHGSHSSHSSHGSHASHASHSSHYSSSSGSSTYSPPTYPKSNSSNDKHPSASSQYSSESKAMKVEGIMCSGAKPLVVIGGSVYGLHDIVNGGEVTAIEPYKVTIKFKNKNKTYSMGELIEQSEK